MNIELQEEVNNKENIQYIENLKCGCWQNNLTEPEIQKMMEKKLWKHKVFCESITIITYIV